MFVLASMKTSEFELQARIYNKLLGMGIYVRAEVRGTVQRKKTGRSLGNKVRLDVVIFSDKECRKPALVIEVKQKRSNAWKVHYLNLVQHRMYSLLDLPVLMVCGEKEAEMFFENIDELMKLPNGIHWLAFPDHEKHEVSMAI